MNKKRCLIITDDLRWLGNLLSEIAASCGFIPCLSQSKQPSDFFVHQFADADPVIIHWECRDRQAGALIHSWIRSINNPSAADKFIVVTTMPTLADIAYLQDLGLRRVVKLSNKERERSGGILEIKHHCEQRTAGTTMFSEKDLAWMELLAQIEQHPGSISEQDQLGYLEKISSLLGDAKPNVRYFEALAAMKTKQNDVTQAIAFLERAVEQSRVHSGPTGKLIQLKIQHGQLSEASNQVNNLLMANRDHVPRINLLAKAALAGGQTEKAEATFQTALRLDPLYSDALAGLAHISFERGDLISARSFAHDQATAKSLASILNDQGIAMIEQGKFTDAISHYLKALLVIEEPEKTPLLFFNIALSYMKWGHLQVALRFLDLALAKNPEYEKARTLRSRLSTYQNAVA